MMLESESAQTGTSGRPAASARGRGFTCLNADFPLTILIGTSKYRRLFTDTLILGNIIRLATIYIKISAVYNYFAIPVVFIALDRRLRGIQRDFELDIGPVFLSVILFYICFYTLRERVLIIEVGF